MPPLNLYARVRFFVPFCTRDRGCSAHPVFPAPSVFEEGEITQTSGESRRENTNARLERRHCEGSEAIHLSACGSMDCFAPLAMTRRDHAPFGRIASGVSGCASGWAVENSGIAMEVS